MERTSYEQFRDDDGLTFHTQTRVYFSQCGADGFLSLTELLKLTSDMAVEDYRQQGMSREFLKENGYGILVSRLAFRFHRMPVENQKIETVTWEQKSQPLQMVRCYRILDEDGNILVSGKSAWIVIDINQRKILPTKNFTLRKPVELEVPMDCLEPGKILPAKDSTVVWSKKISWSDLDTNGHTTNSRYAAFVSDSIPEKYRLLHPTDFRINFAKEAMLGEEVSVSMAEDPENAKLSFTGRTGNGISFEAELFYKKEDFCR